MKLKGYVPPTLDEEEQDCPECDGRGEPNCLTCGGEGYI